MTRIKKRSHAAHYNYSEGNTIVRQGLLCNATQVFCCGDLHPRPPSVTEHRAASKHRWHASVISIIIQPGRQPISIIPAFSTGSLGCICHANERSEKKSGSGSSGNRSASEVRHTRKETSSRNCSIDSSVEARARAHTHTHTHTHTHSVSYTHLTLPTMAVV